MSTRVEFTDSIIKIRALEDAIRSTKKYTEGIETLRKAHPAYPVQGESFPSKVFCKYYEIYPNTGISWDMPVGIAMDLLWKDVICIDVLFKYDYRCNKASMIVKDGAEAVKKLTRAIPKFGECLAELTVENDSEQPIAVSNEEVCASHRPVRIVAVVKITKSA